MNELCGKNFPFWGCPFVRTRNAGYLGMVDFISIKDMLNTMQMRGDDRELIPFSITFVTADRAKRTGGQKITWDEAVFVGGPSSRDKARNPNHYYNSTRNIRHAKSDRITTIHTHLVLVFNGLKVVQ